MNNDTPFHYKAAIYTGSFFAIVGCGLITCDMYNYFWYSRSYFRDLGNAWNPRSNTNIDNRTVNQYGAVNITSPTGSCTCNLDNTSASDNPGGGDIV